MLYHLLYALSDSISWLNVFRYQTFRAMVAFLMSFVLVLVFEPIFIRKMKELGVKGQPIRDDGPKAHEGKRGTPTMGGLVIVLTVMVTTFMLADLTSLLVWLTLAVTAGLGWIGFTDDWRKVTKQSSRGISGRQKLLWQGAITGGATVILLLSGFSTEIHVPFVKDMIFNPGVILFILFVILVVVGSSNAVNLTDGLDGLAIGPIMTVAATYAIFAYLGGHAEISKYLGIAHVEGAGELAIVMSSLTAAGLGFLWYNAYPAQVFMGDAGSLPIGGLLGFIAVLVKHELILVIAGGIFVVEALSVIVQVYSFKMTGKRVFRMAPIHHHFELKGLAEPKIIVRFWIVSIVLALIALTSLKLR